MARILVIVDKPFWQQNSGSTLRIADLGRFLAGQGHELFWLYMRPVRAADRSKARLAYQEGTIYFANEARVGGLPFTLGWSFAALTRNLRKRLTGKSVHMKDYVFGSGKRTCARLISSLRPDIVVTEYLRMHLFVRDLPARTTVRILIDTHDLQHRRWERNRKAGFQGGRFVSREEEAQIVASSDGILAIQKDEAKEFRHMAPNVPVIVAGWAPPVRRLSAKFTVLQRRILYAGSNNPQNRHDVRKFFKEVWPLVVSKMDRPVRLCLAGSITEGVGSDLHGEGIELLGRFKDPADVYEGAHVCINPVESGSGLKIKSVEALAYGKVLITTPIGAEGLDADAPCLVYHTPEEGAARLVELLSDDSRLAEEEDRAWKFAQTHFNPESMYREVGEWIDGLGVKNSQ